MEYFKRRTIFNQGTPQEIVWDVYVGYEENNPSHQYIAEAHCMTRTQPCWVINGYATTDLALIEMNNHVVNYIKLIPNAIFQVICYPDETNQITLDVTCTNKTWNIVVVSGTANPKNGIGKNYGDTVLNMWNAIMTY